MIGIGPNETGAGFKQFIVEPVFLKQLDWVKGSYSSISGNIICAWKRNHNAIILDLTIPVNTTATLILPDNKLTLQKINPNALGVKFLKTEGSNLIFEVHSGNHRFSVNTR